MVCKSTARSQRTRRRILQAALELFSAHGIESTTTRELAAAAKVNEVTLFRHFGSKHGIVKAVLETFFREVAVPDLLNALPDPEVPLTAALTHLTERLLEQHDAREDFFRFVVANTGLHPEYAALLDRYQRKLFARLTAWFAERCPAHLDAEVVASEFIAPIVLRTLRRVLVGSELIPRERFVREHVNIFVALLGGEADRKESPCDAPRP